ncbi:hypothetical protein LRP88_05573 [Fusarium phalaenopsidis]
MDPPRTSEKQDSQHGLKDVEASTGEATPIGVARQLKSRHIQFIALGGTIGTGLFLGIGSALTRAGPLSIFLGYSITALGFAVGWNNWYFCAIAVPAEISAAAILVGYWTESVNVAVWISIFIILIVFLNVFGVGVYGEAEFIFASVKIITMVGLLILAFILDLGGGPQGDRLGFTYWNNPGAMREYMTTGDTGRFLGFFSVLVNAAFSYAGVEIVAVASGESQNPKRNLPKAARRIFWRILFF